MALIDKAYAFNVTGPQTTCDSSGTPINITGATLLLVGVIGNGIGGADVSDPLGNVFLPLDTSPESSFTGASKIYYCYSPMTSSSYYFTLTYNAGVRLTGGLAALNSIGTYDSHQNKNDIGSSATLATGSSGTPSVNNCLFFAITGWGDLSSDAVTASINSSFNLIAGQLADGSGGTHYGFAMAYFVQGTAGALNPTWTYSSSQPGSAANIAVFKPVAFPTYVGVIGGNYDGLM